MYITIVGKIVGVYPKKTGVSRNGNEWVSQVFVIEEQNDESNVCFTVFGQKQLDEYGLKKGDNVAVVIKMECNASGDTCYNNYTCVSCYKKTKREKNNNNGNNENISSFSSALPW